MAGDIAAAGYRPSTRQWLERVAMRLSKCGQKFRLFGGDEKSLASGA